MMTLEQKIKNSLQNTLSPVYLQIVNESHLHALKRLESHFKVICVADKFTVLSKLQRHQLIYKILSNEIKEVHALALHLFTPLEWQTKKKKYIPSSICQNNS